MPIPDRAASRARHELAEQARLAVHLAWWAGLGILSGILAGVSSYIFLEGLDRVTRLRSDHGWVLYLLPLAGFAVGSAYHLLGGRATEGNALLIDQIHEPSGWVPRRMAPLVLGGTWITHLFGGSAGREGTAIQMSGSLSDTLARALRLRDDERRILLIAAISGGFGAVFGVPLAGAVFGLEVQAVGRVRYEAIVPGLAASATGDLVVGWLGYHHLVRPPIVASLDAWLLARVAVAGLVFGLASVAFIELTHAIKRLTAMHIVWPPARGAIGGVAVVGLALLFGRDYLGLSLPLVDRAVSGEHLAIWVFVLKIVFTAVTLGCGFPGGEVTPLFVVGATLGSALAPVLGLDRATLASIGLVAVFAAAANTPLACTVMGAELFGAGALVPTAVGCVVAYVFSNHRGIYVTQRIDTPKGPTPVPGSPTLREWSRRERARG